MKNTTRLMAALALASLLAGCAVNPPMGVLSASRADGTVTVGYLMPGSQPARFEGDFTAGTAVASKVCKQWGYNGAEDINNMTMHECTDANPFGCVTGKQTRMYQCVGGK